MNLKQLHDIGTHFFLENIHLIKCSVCSLVITARCCEAENVCGTSPWPAGGAIDPQPCGAAPYATDSIHPAAPVLTMHS